jgi:processive 1,2-diacylglycerol beta-glucosyltransferase
MKIIITYASAGAGHFKAAEAVYNYLKQDKSFNLTLIDVLDQSNPFFSSFYRRGYDFIVKHFPSFWALCYFLTHARALRPVVQRMRLAINRVNTERFQRFLIRLNPDYILSTHFLSSEIAAYLKRKDKIKARLFSVITDFDVHSFWVIEGTDKYFVACDFTKAQLVQEGVKPEDIYVAGIPIDSKFTRPLSKKEIYLKLGLDENRFTALVMTGSFGIGPLEEIVDLLHQDIQLLVVCAKNQRLYSRLKNKNYPSVKIFGFIDNAEELMAVADVIITKAGGLTISEFLAREVVPVFACAIPGQEKKNIRVLACYGIGQEAKTCRQIKRTVLYYKEHPEELAKIKQKIRELKKPFAVKELSDAICQGGSWPAGGGAF